MTKYLSVRTSRIYDAHDRSLKVNTEIFNDGRAHTAQVPIDSTIDEAEEHLRAAKESVDWITSGTALCVSFSQLGPSAYVFFFDHSTP